MTEHTEIAQKRCKTCETLKDKNTDNFYMMGAGKRYFSAECKQCGNKRRANAYVPLGRHRTKFEINTDLKTRAQELLNSNISAKDVAKSLKVSILTVNKAIAMNILTVPE